MTKIYPSMLSADPSKLGDELADLEKAGADAIHLDVMDGSYVNHITFGSYMIANLRKKSKLRFDVHLMVINPEKHIKIFSDAGADVIIVHSDASTHLHNTLMQIKSLGKKTGIALNPAVSLDCLDFICDLVDLVLVMTVNPGSSGQQFINSQLEKISLLRKRLPSKTEICVDGGINDETAKLCITNGANSLVTGSYLFNGNNYSDLISLLKSYS